MILSPLTRQHLDGTQVRLFYFEKKPAPLCRQLRTHSQPVAGGQLAFDSRLGLVEIRRPASPDKRLPQPALFLQSVNVVLEEVT